MYCISAAFVAVVWCLFLWAAVDLAYFVFTDPTDALGVLVRAGSICALLLTAGFAMLLRQRTCPRP